MLCFCLHDTNVCWYLARQNEHKIIFSDQLLNKLVSYTKNQSRSFTLPETMLLPSRYFSNIFYWTNNKFYNNKRIMYILLDLRPTYL